MENWLLGVLCAPELGAGEKLALVELYPSANAASVRGVLHEYWDRPAVMCFVSELQGVERVEAVVS